MHNGGAPGIGVALIQEQITDLLAALSRLDRIEDVRRICVWIRGERFVVPETIVLVGSRETDTIVIRRLQGELVTRMVLSRPRGNIAARWAEAVRAP